MPQETEWATIGKIVAPFGLQGELKVFSLSDIPDRFAQLDVVYIGPARVPYAIKGVRPYKGDMVILRLLDVNDATTAESLRNHELFIPLDKLAKLPPDAYYQHDIIGLHVVTVDGREIGTVADIIVTGSNDVYDVRATNGQQILLPAIKDVVKRVDLIRHMMYIDPIGGLLDDNEILEEEGE